MSSRVSLSTVFSDSSGSSFPWVCVFEVRVEVESVPVREPPELETVQEVNDEVHTLKSLPVETLF